MEVGYGIFFIKKSNEGRGSRGSNFFLLASPKPKANRKKKSLVMARGKKMVAPFLVFGVFSFFYFWGAMTKVQVFFLREDNKKIETKRWVLLSQLPPRTVVSVEFVSTAAEILPDW